MLKGEKVCAKTGGNVHLLVNRAAITKTATSRALWQLTFYKAIRITRAAKIASYKEYRLCKMPENGKYGDYTYKIPNKYVSINRSEKAIVFHLPKGYIVELRNGRTNQTAELTVTEFFAEVAGKDESAYSRK